MFSIDGSFDDIFQKQNAGSQDNSPQREGTNGHMINPCWHWINVLHKEGKPHVDGVNFAIIWIRALFIIQFSIMSWFTQLTYFPIYFWWFTGNCKSSSSSSMFISSTIVQTLQKQNMIYNNK